MRKQKDPLFEFHCVHLIGVFTLFSIPFLIANTLAQEEAFSEWEQREFNTTEFIEPMQEFCTSSLEVFYNQEPAGFFGIISAITEQDPSAIIDIFLPIIIARFDAPWWYEREIGPVEPCARLLVFAWDVLGFPDRNDVLGRLEGLDCGKEVGELCGGRKLFLRQVSESPVSGFPLIWDIDHLGVTIETQGLGWYRFADALVYILFVSMGCAVVYWYISGRKVLWHFMYIYMVVWIFFLVMLIFPFPAYVIPKIDPKTSENMLDYKTHIIAASALDTRVDYYMYLQWLTNFVFSLGSLFTFQYPYLILIGAFSIFFSFTDSLQAIGGEEVHTIATILEVIITASLGFVAIAGLSVASTLRPSMEQSIRESAWIYWDDMFPRNFITKSVVGLYVVSFLFIYSNFLLGNPIPGVQKAGWSDPFELNKLVA